MINIPLSVNAGLLILLAVGSLDRAIAAPSVDEHHVDARMYYQGHGAIASTYGYLRVLQDASGNALVDVMFSNGNPSIDALFNASIRFLDDAGQVLHEAEVNCPLAAGGDDGATECKVSKSLRRVAFESVEVDFYLSDIPDANVLALAVDAGDPGLAATQSLAR